MKKNYHTLLFATVAVLLCTVIQLVPVIRTEAADHAEAPFVAEDPPADLADVYAFLDPNDNSRVILALDVEGFVVPAELLNLCCFSEHVTYRFEIENTGDARPDRFIDVTFEPQSSRRVAQIAHIKLPNGRTFDGLTTIQIQRGEVDTISEPNPFIVTTDPESGVQFFAGLTDDPFFFDIIGFNRYVIKLSDRNPTAKRDLTRGRDSFAGFNIHMIALSVPTSLLRGTSNIIGINGVTLRKKNVVRLPGGATIDSGELVQIDRMATPVINTVLIPTIPRKNQYNASTTMDDAAGRFVPDIAFSFRFIRTSDEAAKAVAGLLKDGDFLRLDLSKPNRSLGVGENLGTPGFAGFPNGRRPGDDTIDTILFFVNSLQALGDGVDANDKQFLDKFPFFAPPHQPPRKGDDDGTAF